jgi:hypothetical protein
MKVIGFQQELQLSNIIPVHAFYTFPHSHDYNFSTSIRGGMWQHSWLRHYDTRWKVAGSSPDEAIGYFNLPNPSSRTMALGSTKPLNTNEYQESSWGVKGRRCIRLTTLPSSVSRLSRENVGASTSHNPMGFHSLLEG